MNDFSFKEVLFVVSKKEHILETEHVLNKLLSVAYPKKGDGVGEGFEV